VGNWLEAEEAILLCSGQVGAAPDVAHLAVHQAAQLLLLADHPACCGNNGSSKLEAAVEAAAAALEAGEALPYLRRMVQAQGGDVSANVVWGDRRCLLSVCVCFFVFLFFVFFSFFLCVYRCFL
jgi:thymidine phosphorylase